MNTNIHVDETLISGLMIDLTRQIKRRTDSNYNAEKDMFGYGTCYKNDVFHIESDCGGCGYKECIVCEKEINFIHYKSGLTVSWYKYIGRSMEYTDSPDWISVVKECIDSIGA